MSLTPGTQLGPDEITGPIGAGGRGEVYRGRDTRLNRDVAIKVLPAAFAENADRLGNDVEIVVKARRTSSRQARLMIA